ncbi:hypothetical protein [Calothrix sp. CCY 0018]|uniref:hypothetical protein n=1 Tax=Calothrix sp. CCY 0018 TaxID=3103864 RepID=UPI0039C67BE8
MKGLSLKTIALVFLSAFLVINPEVSNAQTRVTPHEYLGVWSSGSGNHTTTPPLTWSAFLNKGKELTAKGLRLIDVETILEGRTRKYVGVWRSGSGSNLITEPLSWSAFLAKGKELTAKGLRLIDVETFQEGRTRKYVGVWNSGSGSNLITAPLSWSAFLAKGNEFTDKGLRLIDVETFQEGRTRQYVGVWSSGSGSNLITAPIRWSAFVNKGKELTAKGLRLIDVESFSESGTRQYIGVWSSGSGSNIIRSPQNWSEFLDKGQELSAKGLRLTDLEAFPVGSSSSGSGSSPSSESFPPTPNYIKLTSGNLGSQNYRIVVDFSRVIDGKPEITLPTRFLSILPTYDDKIIFPDNFCGLKIIKPSRFLWLDNANKVVEQHPYSYVPESSSVKKMYGDNYYLGGIDFTGPIGACSNASDNWQFPFPLTKEGKNPSTNLKLVIELESDSEIKFLNYNISKQPLKADKIFKEINFNKILKTIMAQFDESDSKKRLENFDEFVEEVCESSPDKCPYF